MLLVDLYSVDVDTRLDTIFEAVVYSTPLVFCYICFLCIRCRSGDRVVCSFKWILSMRLRYFQNMLILLNFQKLGFKFRIIFRIAWQTNKTEPKYYTVLFNESWHGLHYLDIAILMFIPQFEFKTTQQPAKEPSLKKQQTVINLCTS